MNLGNSSNWVHWLYAVLTGTLTSIKFSTLDVYPESLDFLNVFDNIIPPAATAASATILRSIFTSCRLDFIRTVPDFPGRKPLGFMKNYLLIPAIIGFSGGNSVRLDTYRNFADLTGEHLFHAREGGGFKGRGARS